MSPVSARIAGLREREVKDRQVVITATRAGSWVQVKVRARGTDRYMKLTDAEASSLIAQVSAALAAPRDDQ